MNHDEAYAAALKEGEALRFRGQPLTIETTPTYGSLVLEYEVRPGLTLAVQYYDFDPEGLLWMYFARSGDSYMGSPDPSTSAQEALDRLEAFLVGIQALDPESSSKEGLTVWDHIEEVE